MLSANCAPVLFVVACVLAGVLAAAPSSGPATSPQEKPATRPARSVDEVEHAFAAAVQTVDQERDRKVAAAQADRLRGLKFLLDRAMSDKDLERAISLREKIRSAEAEPKSLVVVKKPADEPDELAGLEKRLSDTVWQWGGETVRFGGDGLATNAAWDQAGLVTTWKVIDRRTVLLHIERGRNDNRYAILTFSRDADSYSGFGFEGTSTPLPQNHQVKR